MKMITAAVLLFLGSLSAADIDKLKALESSTEGRIGVFAVNTANDHRIEYRANETFPTGCTSKVIGVSAVLKKSMSDPSLLLTKVKYSEEELGEWSPVTGRYVASGMTIQDLCGASISLSDNTAMNLLLKVIGGIQGMNDFARSIGDINFQQDNDWPAEAFSGGFGNLKDSSTPKSMVETLYKLTIGEVLGAPQKNLLITWLINTETGDQRIKSATPSSWKMGHKTGSGAIYGTTNDLAILWPPGQPPILMGIYYTADNKDAKMREDVVAAAAKILTEEFIKGAPGN
jgi:beta-lactamase class A